MKNFTYILILFLFLNTASANPNDKFGFSIGGYNVNEDINLQYSVDDEQDGTIIDLETNLEFPKSKNVLRIDGFYRFNDKHSVNFTYFDMSRKSSATLNDDITFGDETFDAGTTISAGFDTKIFKLSYTYSFINTEKYELAAGLGLFVIDLDTFIGTPLNSTSTTAPLPVIGLRGQTNITDKLALKGNIEFFSLSVDSTYSGQLSDLSLALEYRLFKNFGVGVSYNKQNSNIEVDKERQNLEFDWNYNGYMAYVNFVF